MSQYPQQHPHLQQHSQQHQQPLQPSAGSTLSDEVYPSSPPDSSVSSSNVRGGRTRRAYAAQQYTMNAPPAPNGGTYGQPSPIYDGSAGPPVPPGPPGLAGSAGYPGAQMFTPAVGMNVPVSSSSYDGLPQQPPRIDMNGQSYAQINGMATQFSQMGLQNVNANTNGNGYPQHLQHPQPTGYSYPGQHQPPQHQSATLPFQPLQPMDLMATLPNIAAMTSEPPPLAMAPQALLLGVGDNCDSSHMRCTINAVPTTNALLRKSKLPLALIVRPYTALRDADESVPVVADTVISRCRRCRTYINPFATFLDNGHRWRCNMCNLANDVPQAFDWDATIHEPRDRSTRVELRHAVVEFIAPTEYMVRPPQPLAYLFLLDVSATAVASGLLATATRTILDALDSIPNRDGRSRIGFIGVDSLIHFVALTSSSLEPAIFVVGDLDDPFLPQPQNLLVNIVECRPAIEAFLSRINSMFAGNTNPNNAVGSALKAAHKVISPFGGKVVCLMSSLPNLAVGKLAPRDDAKALGTAKEGALLQTQNSFYKSFAVECSKNQISVDMFLFSQHYQDVASLSCLPRYTGGQTFYYPGWNASRAEDVAKFSHEFGMFLSAEFALEAVMRIRATTGLRMSTFYGNFFNRSSDLCAFPAFPRDQGYVVEVAIEEAINRSVVCFQTAVLHSTCHGERRIRVMTMAIPTTTEMTSLYASADQVAIATYFASKAVEKALSSGLDAARDLVNQRLTEILQTFKSTLLASNTGASTPLQISVNLSLLPVLCLALQKHLGLRKSTQIPSDLRSAALCLLSTLPALQLMNYLYPRLYSLHDMPDDAGLSVEDSADIVMPPLLNLTAMRFVRFGLYLIDDGQTQFLWVGRDAVANLIQDVFGLSSLDQVKAGKTTLPVLDNPFSQRINAIIAKSKAFHPGSVYYPHLFVVREDGDPALRTWASTYLVEDRSDVQQSYQQYLTELRSKITSSS